MSGLRIAVVDLRRAAEVARLHAVWQAAYAQEAALLGVTGFPPLARTVDDLANGVARYYGARLGEALVGAIGVEPDLAPGTLRIGALVVAPAFQRRGIGRRLVQTVVARHGGQTLVVATAAANRPALALYRACGFADHRAQRVEELVLIELRRPLGA